MPTTQVGSIQLSAQLPGEALAIALINLIQTIVEGQPPEVKQRLWEHYLTDMEAWRKFWGLPT